MPTQLSISSDDEDEVWLFERTAQQLQKEYGHTEAEAVDLVNRYYKKFTDPAFCSLYDLSVQTAEFFCREESLSMADRVQFYEAMRNTPDEQAFIQWQRARRLP